MPTGNSVVGKPSLLVTVGVVDVPLSPVAVLSSPLIVGLNNWLYISLAAFPSIVIWLSVIIDTLPSGLTTKLSIVKSSSFTASTTSL